MPPNIVDWLVKVKEKNAAGCPVRAPRLTLYLERAQEGQEVLLLLLGQASAHDEVEELDRVVEGQQPPVVQVGRRVLDPPQGKRLDGTIRRGHHAVDHVWLVEALRR